MTLAASTLLLLISCGVGLLLILDLLLLLLLMLSELDFELVEIRLLPFFERTLVGSLITSYLDRRRFFCWSFGKVIFQRS